jgi:homoserine O-acetyltransferase
MKRQTLHIKTPFELELGNVLPEVKITYSTAGQLNETKDNVVWVFHALTANDNPFDWWSGLVGKEDYFNPSSHFIICANVLGGCNGTTGPHSAHLSPAQTGLNFPKITVKDIVRLHEKLAQHLDIQGVKFAIGGSFGGYQAFEFSLGSVAVENLVVIASATTETPWNIAIHETQRMAILNDASLTDSSGGTRGLEVARGVGLLTYRTPQAYIKTQPRDKNQTAGFKASSYINYQGSKLSKRFSAHAYLTLIDCLDTHDLARGHASLEAALKKIEAKTLCIGIQEDLLASAERLQTDCAGIPNGHFELISSQYGHDGFLIETKKITTLINQYFN